MAMLEINIAYTSESLLPLRIEYGGAGVAGSEIR